MDLMGMVNGLNRMDDTKPFSPTAFLLAVKVIDLFNRLRWADEVAVDLNRMMLMAKCSSKATVMRARDELIERGVLEVSRKGKKGSPSHYRLLDISAFGSIFVPNPVPNPVPINIKDNKRLSSSPLPPSQGDDDNDDELLLIARRNDQVFEAARHAGFDLTGAVMDKLTDLISVHGADAVERALDSCVKYGVKNLAYLCKVLEGGPKPSSRLSTEELNGGYKPLWGG